MRYTVKVSFNLECDIKEEVDTKQIEKTVLESFKNMLNSSPMGADKHGQKIWYENL